MKALFNLQASACQRQGNSTKHDLPRARPLSSSTQRETSETASDLTGHPDSTPVRGPSPAPSGMYSVDCSTRGSASQNKYNLMAQPVSCSTSSVEHQPITGMCGGSMSLPVRHNDGRTSLAGKSDGKQWLNALSGVHMAKSLD